MNGIDCVQKLFQDELTKLEIEKICLLYGNNLNVNEITNERELVEVILKTPSVLQDPSVKISFLKDLLAIINRQNLQWKVDDYSLFLSKHATHTSIYKGINWFCHLNEDARDDLFDEISKFEISEDLKIPIPITDEILEYGWKWKGESTNYYQRYFADRLDDTISVPHHMEVDAEDCKIMETLKIWCDSTGDEKNEPGALVIFNAKFKEHLIKLDKNLIKKLKYEPSHTKRYFVYNYVEKVIFCFVSDVDKIDKALEICISDIKALTKIFQQELENTGIRIVGLVITEANIANVNINCYNCKAFLVSKSTLTNLENFKSWYLNFQKHFDKYWNKNDSESLNGTKETFKLFSLKILSLMAVTGSPYLPNFTKSIVRQIHQISSRLPNPQQNDIIYSPDKYLILKSGFAAGSTLIIQKKIMFLLKQLSSNEAIVYINFDKSSKIHIVMEEFKKKYRIPDNRLLIKKNEEDFSLSQILESAVKEEQNKYRIKHIFVDHFNSESLTTAKAKELINVIQGNNMLKFPTLLIVLQPIEKIRTDIVKQIEFQRESHMFDEFKKHNFQVKELSCVFRTTVQINVLATLAKEHLKNQNTDYKHLKSHLDKNRNAIKTDDAFNGNFNDTCHGIICNLDEAFKQATKINCKKKSISIKSNFQKTRFITKTSFKFVGDLMMGHQIESSNLPRICCPFVFHNDVKNTISLAAILEYIGVEKLVIIHFEAHLPNIIHDAFRLLNLEPTSIADEFQKNGKNILLTKFFQVRGMEFEKVVVLADPYEYHLKHHFPEALTMCSKNLSIILLEGKTTSDKNDVLQNVVEIWKNEDSPVFKEILVKKCKNCKQKKRFYCPPKHNDNSLYINEESSEYKEMETKYEEIEKKNQQILNEDVKNRILYESLKILNCYAAQVCSFKVTENGHKDEKKYR